AHNSNDNAETVLMNLLRGSGISGLKGIAIKLERNISQEKIKKLEFIRPILECDREEIEEYCAEKGLNPKIDRTNLENDYTRNKIRNQLIPYLQKDFNPNVVQSLSRLSELAGEEEGYFKKIILQTYETLKIGENEKEIILDLKKFNQLPKVIKARVLLYTINKVIGTAQGIAKIHVEDCIKLCANNIGNKYLAPNKNVKIFVRQGNIFVKKM
ncbi:MAG: tRNA lysidine(34) synthetase TilS, partial [Clostridia bacterium]|nr:tRNA lysidine(34) synthetase TilS [Clostridia bacterium]